MTKKTYVLTISQVFPQTFPLAKRGKPTGFIDKITKWEKIHTIRSNYELWAKRIAEINAGRAMLSVRVWEGKPYRSKQREVFTFDSVGLEKLTFPNGEFSIRYVNDEHCFASADEIGRNDGLSFSDLYSWFKYYDLTNPMAIIHFSNFRYSQP